MLSRDQFKTLLGLGFFAGSPRGWSRELPLELIFKLGSTNDHPESGINQALRLAASGLENDLTVLVEMIKQEPRLLLQASNVITRGGVSIACTTLYEFFLGQGDPAAAKRIEFGFAEIPEGENERIRQYERYRPHIEALARQIELKQPAYDLRPLIDIIKNSSLEDIAEALNNPSTIVRPHTRLQAAFAEFREAVSPKTKTIGTPYEHCTSMHYEHYTTLQQALDLLYAEWGELSKNPMDYDKCNLVWRQIIGYLQRSLPAVDRIVFARGFNDDKRTLSYKFIHLAAGVFPDCVVPPRNLDLGELGFNNAIFGAVRKSSPCCGAIWGLRDLYRKHISSKNFELAELMPQQLQSNHPTRCVIC